MKIVIPGGTGQVGGLLRRALLAEGHDIVVLSRKPSTVERGIEHRIWDGRTLGDWVSTMDGADAVINLAGRSVSCRYTEENKRQMMDSRVDSARVVGRAIAGVTHPPRMWLQMSTATIYADRRDGFNDEVHGTIGGNEPNVPGYWEFSVRIAKEWEAAQLEADLPHTRRVALRSAMVMTPDRGGVFDALSMMARVGLGGPVAGGRQFVSWIHAADFAHSVSFLLSRDDITGPVNLASPNPVPQAELMKTLRQAWGQRIGLPATAKMASIGARLLGSDPELLLKSRSVIPGRLTEAGFHFDYPTWPDAARDLVESARSRPEGLGLGATLREVRSL
ncbi:MAG: NAD-dependent epimerase/dehydratase [Mycobacterium sp.]|nr:NAD-dependent epimerase/dehydratase [Mycobacterium sp.]